jgi:hypothetical protein
MQLTDILKKKRRGKFKKVVLALLENVPAHRVLATLKSVVYLGLPVS